MAARAADQFDLVCTGTEATKANGPTAAWTTRYSVDVTAMKWCSGACHSIVEITPDSITFIDEKPAIGTRGTHAAYVSRRSGSLTDINAQTFIFWERHATCQRATFSGFPETKF